MKTSIVIPSTHPALPGHFPGAPIVPGALLFDVAMAACGVEIDAGTTVARAKFSAPLLPDHAIDVELARAARDGLQITCSDRERVYLTAAVERATRGDRNAPAVLDHPPHAGARSRATYAESAPPVETILPHAGSMVLLSQVEWWDDAALQCTATSHLADANPLRRAGRLSSLCAIEYGAQAIAAHGSLLTGGPPDPGFLVSVRDFELWAVTIDEVGPVLVIRARAVRRDGRGAIYDVSVGSPSTHVAAGRMGVLLARSP